MVMVMVKAIVQWKGHRLVKNNDGRRTLAIVKQ
jgi:hypothetical protein